MSKKIGNEESADNGLRVIFFKVSAHRRYRPFRAVCSYPIASYASFPPM